jgi:hypothetical protein
MPRAKSAARIRAGMRRLVAAKARVVEMPALLRVEAA